MSSSSLLCRVGSLAASALIFPNFVSARGNYKLQTSWEGQGILDHFNFFDRPDPTNGFVTYTNQSYAEDTGLVKITDSGSLYLGVDYDTVLTPDGPGRDSVRIESNEYYDQGLYVIDIQHMPGSVCGTWPAFWTVGPNWPYDGEIDIIEGVNKHEANKIVLHTSGSCDVAGGHKMSGDLTSGECGEASGTIGCVVQGQQGSSGTPFNKQGGGVYAMEWQREFLKIWYFPRSSIPESLTAGKPDTATFGTPMAHLQGTCNFEERFTHQKLILDTTFCGEWAGNVYGDSGCPLSDPGNPMQSCINYVAQNPAQFKEAYWELNSIKIFKTGGTTETEEQPETTVSSTKTKTRTEEATLPPTTSTTTVTRTETLSTPESTSESAITTTTKPTATAPSEAHDSVTVSKSTSYVTITTTLCPVGGLQTANAAPSAPVPSEESSTATSTTPAPPPPTTPESVVDAPAPPETMSISQLDPPSVPPNSVVYTAPENSPTPTWTIVTSSSQFVSVPTAVSPSLSDTSDYSDYYPSVTQAEGTPTEPSSPVFTGTGSRLSVSMAGIMERAPGSGSSSATITQFATPSYSHCSFSSDSFICVPFVSLSRGLGYKVFLCFCWIYFSSSSPLIPLPSASWRR
ncbi:putative GPI anchored endo-1,3(4)-beta-glucanase [Aspergillus lucknowensis]|uniref:endo-1,3(4)-beta-glucanase n=1 Tax=Aspergillus lucknowensis TaxID=176173 RepID=A0ABR4M1J4_9EURO